MAFFSILACAVIGGVLGARRAGRRGTILGIALSPLTLWGLVILAILTRPPPGPKLCRKCSYDLTGNVSGVCPECGSPIALEVLRIN